MYVVEKTESCNSSSHYDECVVGELVGDCFDDHGVCAQACYRGCVASKPDGMRICEDNGCQSGTEKCPNSYQCKCSFK